METTILDEQTRKALRTELEDLRYHLYELTQSINDSEDGNYWFDQSQEISAIDVWARDSSRADQITVQLKQDAAARFPALWEMSQRWRKKARMWHERGEFSFEIQCDACAEELIEVLVTQL